MIGASPLNEELRRMPADQLAETADYIQTLIEERRLRRAEMIDATAGSLSGNEGAALESALAECSTIDETAW